MRIHNAALAALLLLAASPAGAQPVLGARLGWSIPAGEVLADGPLPDLLAGAIPLELEAGWQVVPRLTVSAWVSYGLGRPAAAISDGCDAAGLDCGARVVRLGLRGEWALRGGAPRLLPWAGLGAGYEWTRLDDARATGKATVGWSGMELVQAQAGLDVTFGPVVRAGPFVSCGLGRYGRAWLEADGASGSTSLDARATHAWITIGLRGRFALPVLGGPG